LDCFSAAGFAMLLLRCKKILHCLVFYVLPPSHKPDPQGYKTIHTMHSQLPPDTHGQCLDLI